MNYDYGLTPEQSRCLARERDEARAEVERLKAERRAALESLRERCAEVVLRLLSNYVTARRAAEAVRAVPLEP